MPGVFVAVEGPEGAGKTTLVERLTARVRDAGRRAHPVREPGGTETAEAARALVLDPSHSWEAAAELFLILAARAELVEKVIRPALGDDGTVVISDRYDLSTEAYQVAGRGLPRDDVLAANALATGGLKPDLTLVLDIPPGVGRERQAAQGKELDRMERETDAWHDRVAQAFREARGPGVVHLDAGQPPDALADAAWKHLTPLLGGTP
ncbi:MAG: dTMP kinase [Gemmatimonadales bacterium]|jgi:dTMP kinase